jgi:hypothetical protein
MPKCSPPDAAASGWAAEAEHHGKLVPRLDALDVQAQTGCATTHVNALDKTCADLLDTGEYVAFTAFAARDGLARSRSAVTQRAECLTMQDW